MQIPEKIYISDFGSELSYDWHTEHCFGSDIEYTRTDVLIEKAATWIANRYQANGSYLCANDIDDFVIEETETEDPLMATTFEEENKEITTDK